MKQDVDARDKRGHDESNIRRLNRGNEKGAVATAAAPFNCKSVKTQFEFDGRISTRPIALTPLSAIAILLSRVTNMWRTMPPPSGISQVWNFSVFGSKRTSVFGRTFDSQYQMTSSITAMP